MKLFRSNAKTIKMNIVELPRQSWSYLPPKKWQIALTVAVIIVSAVVWAVT
jgi:hypothetical protein